MASVRVIRVETARAREREDKRVSPPARVSLHLRAVQHVSRVTQANYVSVCQTNLYELRFRVCTKQITKKVPQCTVGFRSFEVQKQPVLRAEPGSKFLRPLLSRPRFFKKCHILLVFSDFR